MSLLKEFGADVGAFGVVMTTEATITDALVVAGAATFTEDVTIDGAATMNGDVNVNGTLSADNLSVSGTYSVDQLGASNLTIHSPGSYTTTLANDSNGSLVINPSTNVILQDGKFIVNSLYPTPATYYVSTLGNDTTGTGSETNPFLTIQHAITVAEASNQASATIQIQAGTYIENLAVTKNLILNGSLLNIRDNVRTGSAFPLGNSVTRIIGSITFTPALNNPILELNSLWFQLRIDQQIQMLQVTYYGTLVVDNCYVSRSVSGSTLPLVSSTATGFCYFSQCYFYALATTTVPVFDMASVQLSLVNCAVIGNNNTSLIACKTISANNCLFVLGGGGTPAAVGPMIYGVNSGYEFTNCLFRTKVPATVFLNTGTTTANLTMYDCAFEYTAQPVAGTHFILQNTSTAAVVARLLNAQYVQYETTQTPLSSPNFFSGLVTVVTSAYTSSLNMGQNSIINAPQVSNTAGNVELVCNSSSGKVILTGGALTATTSSGAISQFLILTINGVQYKVQLHAM